MTNIKLILIAFILFLSSLITNISSQVNVINSPYEDSLCAYTWNSNINNCPAVLECIDPVRWNDTIIDAPRNITHISKLGIKLCLEDIRIIDSVEIIFIMDLSSSMNPAYGANAGDPYKKRPSALQAGFYYLIDSTTDFRARAGYIGFHTNLQSDQLLTPVSVNTQPGINSLNQMVQKLQDWVDFMATNSDGYGTNYYAAFEEAINYFNDPGIVHHRSQAIIFITDGEPDTNAGATAAQVQTLISKEIQIYGIFLGAGIGVGLDTICKRTNGWSYLVPPSNTDTLAKVVKKVVKSLIKTIYECYCGKSLYAQNFSTGSNAIAVSYYKISDTVWTFILDKTLPLKRDLNQIQINSLFSTPSGHDTTLTFKFYLYVGGDTSYTSECYYCWYRTQMDVFVNNISVDTLSSQNNNYTLKFFYFGEDSLNTINIRMKTINKKDTGTIVISNPTFDGLKWTFSKNITFKVITGSPILNDSITEADLEDAVTFYWRHAKEPMDTAVTQVAVVSPTFSSYSFLPLKNRQIKILQTKNSRGTSITVQFSAPVKNAQVTLTAPNGKMLSTCKGTDTRQVSLETMHISNGVYFITISAAHETITRKIILTQ